MRLTLFVGLFLSLGARASLVEDLTSRYRQHVEKQSGTARAEQAVGFLKLVTLPTEERNRALFYFCSGPGGIARAHDLIRYYSLLAFELSDFAKQGADGKDLRSEVLLGAMISGWTGAIRGALDYLTRHVVRATPWFALGLNPDALGPYRPNVFSALRLAEHFEKLASRDPRRLLIDRLLAKLDLPNEMETATYDLENLEKARTRVANLEKSIGKSDVIYLPKNTDLLVFDDLKPGLHAEIVNPAREGLVALGPNHLVLPQRRGSPVTIVSHAEHARRTTFWIKQFNEARTEAHTYLQSLDGFGRTYHRYYTRVSERHSLFDNRIEGKTRHEIVLEGHRRTLRRAANALADLGYPVDERDKLERYIQQLRGFEADIDRQTTIALFATPLVALAAIVAVVKIPVLAVTAMVVGSGANTGRQLVQIYGDGSRKSFDLKELYMTTTTAAAVSPALGGAAGRAAITILGTGMGTAQVIDDIEQGHYAVAAYDGALLLVGLASASKSLNKNASNAPSTPPPAAAATTVGYRLPAPQSVGEGLAYRLMMSFRGRVRRVAVVDESGQNGLGLAGAVDRSPRLTGPRTLSAQESIALGGARTVEELTGHEVTRLIRMRSAAPTQPPTFGPLVSGIPSKDSPLGKLLAQDTIPAHVTPPPDFVAARGNPPPPRTITAPLPGFSLADGKLRDPLPGFTPPSKSAGLPDVVLFDDGSLAVTRSEVENPISLEDDLQVRRYLDAIHHDPLDDEARVVLADYLREKSDPALAALGEFIRAQIELAQDPSNETLSARTRALAATYAARWFPGKGQLRLHRGLPVDKTYFRLRRAEQLLGRKLSVAEKKEILIAHALPPSLRARIETLQKAGFPQPEIRLLLRRGICGDSNIQLILRARALRERGWNHPLADAILESETGTEAERDAAARLLTTPIGLLNRERDTLMPFAVRFWQRELKAWVEDLEGSIHHNLSSEGMPVITMNLRRLLDLAENRPTLLDGLTDVRLKFADADRADWNQTLTGSERPRAQTLALQQWTARLITLVAPTSSMPLVRILNRARGLRELSLRDHVEPGVAELIPPTLESLTLGPDTGFDLGPLLPRLTSLRQLDLREHGILGDAVVSRLPTTLERLVIGPTRQVNGTSGSNGLALRLPSLRSLRSLEIALGQETGEAIFRALPPTLVALEIKARPNLHEDALAERLGALSSLRALSLDVSVLEGFALLPVLPSTLEALVFEQPLGMPASGEISLSNRMPKLTRLRFFKMSLPPRARCLLSVLPLTLEVLELDGHHFDDGLLAARLEELTRLRYLSLRAELVPGRSIFSALPLSLEGLKLRGHFNNGASALNSRVALMRSLNEFMPLVATLSGEGAFSALPQSLTRLGILVQNGGDLTELGQRLPELPQLTEVVVVSNHPEPVIDLLPGTVTQIEVAGRMTETIDAALARQRERRRQLRAR